MQILFLPEPRTVDDHGKIFKAKVIELESLDAVKWIVIG